MLVLVLVLVLLAEEDEVGVAQGLVLRLAAVAVAVAAGIVVDMGSEGKRSWEWTAALGTEEGTRWERTLETHLCSEQASRGIDRGGKIFNASSYLRRKE
jgi:hypothetical protein